jgi:hypothetical protein
MGRTAAWCTDWAACIASHSHQSDFPVRFRTESDATKVRQMSYDSKTAKLGPLDSDEFERAFLK